MRGLSSNLQRTRFGAYAWPAVPQIQVIPDFLYPVPAWHKPMQAFFPRQPWRPYAMPDPSSHAIRIDPSFLPAERMSASRRARRS